MSTPIRTGFNDKFLLTAVSTTSEKSAKASAEKHSSDERVVKPYFGSTTHIANDPNVDFVAVAISSLGKSTAETREFAEAARAKGLRTVVGTQGRQSDVLKKVKSLIASGKIGKITSTTVVGLVPRSLRFWGPEVEESKVSITHDPNAGCTMIDVSISATSTIVYPTAKIVGKDGAVIEERPNTVPDHVAFSGMLDSVPGRLSLSWEIDGEEGSIRLTDTAPNSAFTNLLDPKLYVNGELVPVESAGLPGMIAGNWEEFAKGTEGTHATIEDALKVHEVLDAINASIRERREIDL
ncbi:hypothetical protein BDZ89DRAFT_1085273 [Hymenopellis radicata]|nr:hypothetical protein BDZ89DRAFT_1085273 [Hymenopellis radicata]